MDGISSVSCPPSENRGGASLALLGACLGLAIIAVGATVLWLRQEPHPAPERITATISVTNALGGGDIAGFARATAPRELSFPRDHGPHPEFRTEWWYYTGNLRTADGRHIGFQLTFFRQALAPPREATATPLPAQTGPHSRPPARRASAWATTQVYFAHFAVTDTKGGHFLAFSRSSRGALGLAGAEAEPFHVWADDWSAE